LKVKRKKITKINKQNNNSFDVRAGGAGIQKVIKYPAASVV
jgi:hypothetical protein